MLRRALTAASSARASPSNTVASASSKLPLTRLSWHHVRRPRKQEPKTLLDGILAQSQSETNNKTTQSPSTTRLFTTAQFTAFTASPPAKDPSPFRLSANKSDTSPPPSFEDVYYSPYQPKRQWPPDMSKLSPKHQFRLERKYRRRAALKYARPTFMKATMIGQWVIIGFVIIYAVLFMEWESDNTPFHGIRESFFSGLRAIFSSAPPPAPRRDQKDNTASDESS
ncbi:hypothetical protein N7491_003481 [Penicillium cf. griseofulvum]|uniref:Uncharacterized protein n=1 Tax=Penicillium cf. griseofulvum TaxID=2972120 RepID=A0A9W9T1Z8_9EURO|nr:hypothetical protein N7472_002343 [Penicillium cf. griseofulvum]KAJ5441075.1 hypothetical protein N7491_003481 [Penicillium cf. griseofulvum]KAJ5449122.1 hypothetical protein N7445_003943 [Penicillium cf. griseofulvum]